MTTEAEADTRELLAQARTVLADLETFWARLESSHLDPGTKSTLGRCAAESRARVDDVIQSCGQSLSDCAP